MIVYLLEPIIFQSEYRVIGKSGMRSTKYLSTGFRELDHEL